MKNTHLFLLSVMLFFTTNIYCQLKIGNNAASIRNASLLEMESTNKGMVLPRVSLSNTAGYGPLDADLLEGTLVYNTNASCISGQGTGLYVWNGSGWQKVAATTPNAGWNLAGNEGTTDGTHFIGTTDNAPLSFKVANIPYGRFDNTALNISIGRNAGSLSGTGNISLGDSAGNHITNADAGVFIGQYAGKKNTTGSYNVMLGAFAGESSTTGNYNTFLGTGAGYSNTESGSNTFAGYFAGGNHKVGNSNTAIGLYALFTDSSGERNLGIGNYTLQLNKTGKDNLAIGYSAGYNSTASLNCFFGNYAGGLSTTGVENAFMGHSAGNYNYEGSYNTSMGAYAGNTSKGNSNVFVGHKTGSYMGTGFENTLVGRMSGCSFTVASTGSGNTTLGAYAGQKLVDASNNVLIGKKAGNNTSFGNSNVAIGVDAFSTASIINNTVAIGDSALKLNGTGASGTQGWYNTAVGSKVLYKNTTGSANTSIGFEAMGNNINGSNNLAVGQYALGNNTSGSGNLAIGNNTMTTNTTGTNNTTIGYDANVGADGLTNATAIGYKAMVSQSNSLILGGINGVNGGTNTKVGIGTTTPTATLDVSGRFKLGADGSVLFGIIKQTADANVPSINASSDYAQTFTVTGAEIGSTVMVSPASQLPAGVIIAYARANAADTVTVVFTNTAAVARDPAQMNYYISVIK